MQSKHQKINSRVIRIVGEKLYKKRLPYKEQLMFKFHFASNEIVQILTVIVKSVLNPLLIKAFSLRILSNIDAIHESSVVLLVFRSNVYILHLKVNQVR